MNALPRLAAAIAVAWTIASCALPAFPQHAADPSARATMKMWDFAVFPSGDEFRLELAISDRERALGYMFRKEIGAQEAMLFFFEEAGLHGIWMRNCLVPLDLIWMDRNHEVVHIVHSAPPCAATDECPSHVPMRNANFVLEAAGGTAERTGLQVGDRIQLVEIDPGNRR